MLSSVFRRLLLQSFNFFFIINKSNICSLAITRCRQYRFKYDGNQHSVNNWIWKLPFRWCASNTNILFNFILYFRLDVELRVCVLCVHVKLFTQSAFPFACYILSIHIYSPIVLCCDVTCISKNHLRCSFHFMHFFLLLFFVLLSFVLSSIIWFSSFCTQTVKFHSECLAHFAYQVQPYVSKCVGMHAMASQIYSVSNCIAIHNTLDVIYVVVDSRVLHYYFPSLVHSSFSLFSYTHVQCTSWEIWDSIIQADCVHPKCYIAMHVCLCAGVCDISFLLGSTNDVYICVPSSS